MKQSRRGFIVSLLAGGALARKAAAGAAGSPDPPDFGIVTDPQEVIENLALSAKNPLGPVWRIPAEWEEVYKTDPLYMNLDFGDTLRFTAHYRIGDDAPEEGDLFVPTSNFCFSDFTEVDLVPNSTELFNKSPAGILEVPAEARFVLLGRAPGRRPTCIAWAE